MTHASLQAILDALRDAELLADTRGTLPEHVSALTDESRAVQGGTLFVAVRGSERDGHAYLDAAAHGGATVAIVDDPARTTLPSVVVRGSSSRAQTGPVDDSAPSCIDRNL